jgi:hypothetical protein
MTDTPRRTNRGEGRIKGLFVMITSRRLRGVENGGVRKWFSRGGNALAKGVEVTVGGG